MSNKGEEERQKQQTIIHKISELSASKQIIKRGSGREKEKEKKEGKGEQC